MWSEIKWLANLKFTIDIILAISAVAIAFFSWRVYQNQLKVIEYQNSPKFRIIVSTEPVDNLYERYIQVNNLGEPIKTDIETQAIMTVQIQDGNENKKINIHLEENIYYLVKIAYKDYKDHNVTKFYLVGKFENQEISEGAYKKLLKTKYTLDVGNYLNSPVDDKLMEILNLTIRSS